MGSPGEAVKQMWTQRGFHHLSVLWRNLLGIPESTARRPIGRPRRLALGAQVARPGKTEIAACGQAVRSGFCISVPRKHPLQDGRAARLIATPAV